MNSLQFYSALASTVQVAFVFAFGACVGSLLNVLVYRLPLGLGVITPASRCPSCATRLTWRENIPIMGWVMLRGRCRFCRSPISAEYPLVELLVGLMFAGLFVLWYVVPNSGGEWLGIDWSAAKPEWARSGFDDTWPMFTVIVAMAASLVAVTLIDARTFTIPLVLVVVPTVFAIVAHTGWAAWVGHDSITGRLPSTEQYASRDELWSLWTPGVHGWSGIGAGLGGMVGVGVSMLLLKAGLIRRSFADYDEWEREELAKHGLGPDGKPLATSDQPSEEGGPSDGPTEEPTEEPADESGTGGESESEEATPAELWIQYPHARREMFKEAAFLGAPALFMLLGWLFTPRLAGPWTLDVSSQTFVPSTEAPVWLAVLGGVTLGYLVGGGVVWGVRLLGSLAFGKEAMGLGDVHLMAMVGACLGWIDTTLAFFGAAFVALVYYIVAAVVGKGPGRAMPYGPFLAVATLLVVLLKPLIEIGLGMLVSNGGPVPLP